MCASACVRVRCVSGGQESCCWCVIAVVIVHCVCVCACSVVVYTQHDTAHVQHTHKYTFLRRGLKVSQTYTTATHPCVVACLKLKIIRKPRKCSPFVTRFAHRAHFAKSVCVRACVRACATVVMFVYVPFRTQRVRACKRLCMCTCVVVRSSKCVCVCVCVCVQCFRGESAYVLISHIHAHTKHSHYCMLYPVVVALRTSKHTQQARDSPCSPKVRVWYRATTCFSVCRCICVVGGVSVRVRVVPFVSVCA